MTQSLRALLQRPSAAIMGIVNVTPDSFSDGGKYSSIPSALNQVEKLLEQGADIIDVGGESTRPGAQAVSEEDELTRVIPVIEAVKKQFNAIISVDTSKPQVMQAAVDVGASMVNDVNALQADGALQVVANTQASVCLMHMQGSPRTMQIAAQYDDVVRDVEQFLAQRIECCLNVGIVKDHILVDPGIGFGKNVQHNLALLNAVGRLKEQLDCEVLIGVSRKSLIDKLLNRTVEQRMPASVGLAVQAVLNGAKIVRVHDVIETHDAIRSVEAVLGLVKNQ